MAYDTIFDATSGLFFVYKYSQVYDEPITNDTAPIINRLCMSDPFFRKKRVVRLISCVILSNYSEKDLTHESGVIDTVNYEITSRDSEMSTTWAEYIESTLHRVNDIHGKKHSAAFIEKLLPLLDTKRVEE